MTRRILTLLLAVSLTLAAAPALAYNGDDDLKITPEPSAITLFYAFDGNGAPKGDMPIWQEAARLTNVQMRNVANESITDVKESLNTMLASGKLPDLIQGHRDNLAPLISQGAFLPLDDLIAQYGQNIQRFLEEYPDAKRAGTGPDGQFYYISGTLGGDPSKALPSMGFFIRQDWLDKLGLAQPTTLEEYKSVLYAFRNEDPNGNGEKDEVPWFYRDTGIWPLLELWNAENGWYIKEDGKIYQGRAQEEYKAALKELAQWYADGVIDPEIFTRGSQARQFLLGNDQGGATIDWFSSTGAMNDTVREQVPDINFVAFAPPGDISGVVKTNRSRTSLHSYAWGISIDCEDPVKAIQFMDFFFTPVGQLLTYGIEGDDYTLVDGSPVPTKKALTNPAGYPNYLRSIGCYEIGRYGNIMGELAAMNKQARDGYDLYAASDWVRMPFPTLVFNEDERYELDNYIANLNALTDEYQQRCLLGAQDVDSTWNQYIANLEAMGLIEATAAYNSAYERYLGE
ncbi:MAG: extracellular solute-binding protein [Oscillospiraceae bacterium]|jgi:putative aldouronate transport system substrate-binding protein|nr:extracellular solute-binding protein [Oscillospiraceae bacterium]